MDAQQIAIIVGSLVAVVTGVTALLKTRGEGRVESEKSKAARDQYIDERVDAQLKLAWARIKELEGTVEKQGEEITLLKEDREKMGRMNARLKEVVQWWFADLLRWDNTGRVGDMPLPSPIDMQLLELDDLNDTKTRSEVLRLRSIHEREQTNEQRRRPRH